MFLAYLYKLIGNKYCFIQGAFVLGDYDQLLYKFLFSILNFNIFGYANDPSNKYFIELKKHIVSHFKLKEQQQTKLAVDNNLYETWLPKNNNPEKSLQYEARCECPAANEEDKKHDIQNVKWYQFVGKDQQYYIFLKLEGYPTKSLKHAVQGGYRYFFPSKKKVFCTPTRREDCTKNNDCVLFPKKDQSYQYTVKILQEGSTEHKETSYGRVGDEMFVPAAVTKLFLSKIFGTNTIPLQFIYDDIQNTVTINKASDIGFGGKRKFISRRRNNKNKKGICRTKKYKYKTTSTKRRRRQTR